MNSLEKQMASLNSAQLQAVTLPPQSALILAGAGSGKTSVLTTRMAWLISTGQTRTQSILAVTFTNKAAKEMMTRLSALLPMNTRGMWVGTFHGLCNRFLRAHHREANLPATFQILDTQDQLSAIKRLLKSMQVDTEKFQPKQVQNFINGSKEDGLRPADVEANDYFYKKLVEIYTAYDAQCQREGVVDFPELLLRAYEVLKANEALRMHYQTRFTHVLVDEFQDTNTLQYAWLKLIASPQTVMMAVGDDDQSIYAFRGAKVENMRLFEREFAQHNVIKLEQNYRSYGHILNAANALISQNNNRLGKNLWTDRGEGEPIRIYEATSDYAEADFVIEEIKAQINEGAVRRDIAVLYRANAQSRVIEHALFNAGVPYRVYGGLRFFERAEIKHALAYLRLIDNPHDDTAFMRVVNFPTRGIGARTIEQLQDTAKSLNSSLWGAVQHASGSGAAKLLAFAQMIDGLRFDTQHLPLPELVDHVTAHSGLIAHYKADREGADRLENLSELINAAAAFVQVEGHKDSTTASETDEDDTMMTPLAGFLSHAALEAGDNQAQAGQDAVQLMTVHAAKGLEFNTVFILGLEEGLFPHENSLSDADGVQEERRLMYVAITRARVRLYMTLAQQRMLHGQTRYGIKSRFLDELSDDDVKWLTPRVRYDAWSNTAKATEDTPSFGTFKESKKDTLGYRVGQSVSHAKFGDGVIVKLEGSGEDTRAYINFGAGFGIKCLALNIAKLETH
ncbi:UvrD-helicase domain-containing protein [Hydromonas duriensis]|uniref:DNA 3'-5' helicase n=1 Tax=Hydromonas duriensis TaxID=1527608 RepID=A0A4V3DK58_9BURK|nr:UvrD-helicase domain-containing protein [Hydromonas duriensis]TDR32787.1 DNA helicase-2/ATP-dependent DNA helicase PcrA [Hydromonas duriensis]